MYLCSVISFAVLVSNSPKKYLSPLKLAPLAVIALLVPSPIVGHDSWLHLIWLEQFASLVKEGMLYPRWLHLSNGGFGSPTFYFYPPLAAFLATIYSFISTSAQDVDLFRFVAYIGTLGSIFSFRYYLRTLGIESKLAWAGGMVYAMLPYRAVDLVLRNALGEHLAFLWIPLVFAGTEAMCGGDMKSRTRGFILSAVSFALLLLTNIPSAIVIAITLPIYALLRHGPTVRVAMISVGQLLAGALLVSFYLLPAISLRDLIQPAHLWDAGTSRTGEAFTFAEFFSKQSQAMTNANLVMLIGGVIALVIGVKAIRKQPAVHKGLLTAWSTLIALALAMQIPGLATFVYQLPIVSYLQFSWRWNIILVPAIVTVFALHYQQQQSTVLFTSAAFAIATVMVVTGFNAKYKRHQSTDVLKIEYSDAFEYIPSTALHSTHAIADFVAKHRNDPPVLLSGPGTATLTAQHGDTREYTFDLPQPTTATFHLFYWPLWELEVDGVKMRTSHDSLGRMKAVLPIGKHTAVMRL
jgi:hypothetical protein